MSASAPVAPDERVDLLDVVRGFALWGVCLANLVPWFSGGLTLSEKERQALPTWPVDRVTDALLNAFVHGRFVMTFSFLFGLGFAIQYLRAESRSGGAAATRLLARRLTAMLVLGVAHGLLVWHGDILATYAVLGVLLLLARNWPVRRLLAAGLALVVLGPIAWSVAFKLAPIVSHGAVDPAAGFAAVQTALTKQLPALVAQRSYGAVLSANLLVYDQTLTVWGQSSWMPPLGGLFLLGLCVVRAGVLRRLDSHRDRWRTVLAWAATIALLGYIPRLYMELAHVDPKKVPLDVMGMIRVLRIVGQPAMSLTYVCALVLLFQRPAWRRRLLALAPVGRMALTNYLTQSLLAITLFYGVGFGLYRRVGSTPLVVLSIVTIAAQAVLSRWWLQRYRFGPAEWLWRSMTYGRLQPMRLAGEERAVPEPVAA